MFGFHSVNTSDVNASSCKPGERWDSALQEVVWDAPVLSINATEDINNLSWTSPYFTDFFIVYWSDEPFTSVDEPGVHAITADMPTPGTSPAEEVSYSHTIPSAFSLSVIYYRVVAFNENGETLSNQVDNYNFKLAIYEEIYRKTLDDLLLRFTPEIRRQYEDSKLWRSFVQSLASEVAQSRFEIKEALKQLNLQKAVDVFLNMWNSVIGISRNNVTDVDTGELRPETDVEYRHRLIDNVFWDKISNLALKKTMLLRLGYDGTVLDAGVSNEEFKIIPEIALAKLRASHGLKFFPGETISFLYSGPNGSATCVSDDGATLVYSNYVAEPGGPDPPSQPYGLVGRNSFLFYATPTAPPLGGFAELISQGAFATSAALANWTNLDSSAEGPLDTSRTYVFRPTTYTKQSFPPWADDIRNPQYAYDTNEYTYALLAGSSVEPSVYDFHGIPVAGTTFANVNLIVSIVNNAGYSAYSLDGGGSWTYITSASTPLSPSQDFSLVRVRVYNASDRGGTSDDPEYRFLPQNYPAYVYDIRIEGSGTLNYGVSSWSSEYGGSMKLQYGVACREYQINTSYGIGVSHTLTFQNSNGLVYVRMGTASGNQDIWLENVYSSGYTTISFTPMTAITYLRFYTRHYSTTYVDNVSVIGPAPLTSGTLAHDPLYNAFGFWAVPGSDLEFVSQDGLTKSYGKFVSNVGGILTFEHVGVATPHADDYVKESVIWGQPEILTVLLDEPVLVTSTNVSTFKPKMLSNIYSVNLGVSTLNDSALNDIYEEISPLAALGNVLTKIIQDVGVTFEDWNTTFDTPSIPYGAIFMGAPTYTGGKDTETNWSIGEVLYLDNQWTTSSGKTFYGNDGPDDIISLTRTS